MAGISTVAIVTAIKERLTGTKTGVRAMTAGELASDTYATLTPAETARRAVITPRFDVVVTGTKRSGPLSEMGSSQWLEADVEVRCTYALTPAQASSESSRETLRATAADDGEQVRQSLMWPGGLTLTSAAVATNIVSGCMARHKGSTLVRESFVASGGVLEWRHQFSCVVAVSPAIT